MRNQPELITKIAELKRRIGQIIKEIPDNQLLTILEFHEGMEFPKYKITVEALEEDFFVDAKGTKWKRVRDEDEEHGEI